MALPNEPITKQEMYLSNIAGQNTALPKEPITREEMYLDYIAKNGGTGEGDMKKSIYDSDNSVASAGGIKMFVNQKIGTLPQRVGTVEGKVTILEGQMLEVENDLDNLGTASTKNSISVVTQSTDLVESGAVKDIVGWGNKNLWKFGSFTGAYSNVPFSLPAGTYTFSFSSSSPVGIRLFYNENDSVVVSGESSFNIVLEQPVVKINYSCNDSIATNVQLEVGSTATAYEPYHASASDSLAEKCDNTVIGTVEGANASKAWSVREHFIKDGAFKEVTQPIASGGAISDSNTVNRPIADCLVKQATFSGTTSNVGALIVSTSQSRAVIFAEVVGCIVDLYKRSEGYGAVVKTPQGEPVVETSVSGTYYYI